MSETHSEWLQALGTSTMYIMPSIPLAERERGGEGEGERERVRERERGRGTIIREREVCLSSVFSGSEKEYKLGQLMFLDIVHVMYLHVPVQ